ncbi:hypothetical protein X975_15568, partial [Stegodyphus mimosarum]
MINYYVKRLSNSTLYYSNICTIPFVGSQYRICSPVCPIDIISE